MSARTVARRYRFGLAGVFLAVAAVAAGAAVILGTNGIGPSRTAQADAASPGKQSDEKRIPVVLTAAKTMTFENRIVVSGSVHAKCYAMVSARIPGTLDAVFVDEGDRVEAGGTQLFQTDSLKLTKAVDIAKQDLAVAEASVEEKRALLTRDLAAQQQANADVARYRELLKRNAVAGQAAEQQETRVQQCDADVQHTEALIDLAAAQLEQARLALTIAEKDLADSLVAAPISGWVSERFCEPGEMAGAGTPVLRIEDTAVLEVSVFLPEQFYAHVLPRKTKMRVEVGDIDLGQHAVSYKSPTVHQKLRTFAVKGLVESPPEGVVPGCLAEVTIVTDSREGIGVPSGAVQTRAGESVVFVVEGEKARMLPVTTGADMEGWLEVLEGLASGEPVVSMGQALIEEDAPVSIVTEDDR